MGCSASKPKQAPVVQQKKGASEPQKVTKVEEDDKTKVQRFLKKHEVDSNPNVDDRYTLFLDLINNKKGCHDFLNEAKGTKVGKLRKFSLFGMCSLTKAGQADFGAFINGAKFNSLQILYLHGGEDMNFHFLATDTCKNLISVTQKVVYIDSFALTGEDIEDILEGCTQAKHLYLVNCRVGEISEEFVIDTDKIYTLKHLDLYYTLMNDSKYIDYEKMNYIVEALSETNLQSDLKTIHCFEEDFSKIDLNNILSNHDMSAHAVVDREEPTPEE